MGIYGTQILSGLAVQRQYESTALSDPKASSGRTRGTTRQTEDTVEISPQAYRLFNTQNAKAFSETESTKTDAGSEATETEGAAEASASSTVSKRLEEVETEISNLEAEIALLEEAAGTDDIAATLLQSKQARLKTLEAMLTGLIAKSTLVS